MNLESGISPLINPTLPVLKNNASWTDVVAALSNYKGTVYTVDETSGRLSGVITYNDLAKFTGAKGEPPKIASDIATKQSIVGVRQDAELWQLLKIMNGDNESDRPFDRLPVLDLKNRPVGFIDRTELRSKLSGYQIPLSS